MEYNYQLPKKQTQVKSVPNNTKKDISNQNQNIITFSIKPKDNYKYH